MKPGKFNCALLAVLIFVLAALFYQISLTGDIIASKFLSPEDYVRVYAQVSGNDIYLVSGCDALVMSTTEEQAVSISAGLQNVSGPRPLTHDLIKDMLDLLNAEVLIAKIEKFESDTYYARLFIQQGNRILNLDSRPSDAIAIAIRYNKPVLVKEELFKNAGKRVC